jgi:hypothetical protein
VLQWAATLTQSGANLPFVYPLRADKLPTGFQVRPTSHSALLGFTLLALEHKQHQGICLITAPFVGDVEE